MKKILLFALFIHIVPFLMAQSIPTGLMKLSNTKLMKEFNHIREESATVVAGLKARQSKMQPNDILLLKDTYNSSAEAFNQILFNIKRDLLNKKRRKFIVQFPDSYTKEIESDLTKAKNYYQNTFLKELNDATNGEVSSASLLLLLPEIIKYITEATAIIQQLKEEAKKYNEALLQKDFIEPNRFKTWEEIKWVYNKFAHYFLHTK